MVMEREGVTKAALATATGLSRNYLSKRLRDEVPFTLNDVEVICEVLGIQLPKLG
jgi:transcriptional regulator with XRE-family HTH domain